MTVHILAYGRVLCGFSELPPGEWPEPHRWVGFNETDLKQAKCSECLDVLERWKEAAEADPRGASAL